MTSGCAWRRRLILYFVIQCQRHPHRRPCTFSACSQAKISNDYAPLPCLCPVGATNTQTLVREIAATRGTAFLLLYLLLDSSHTVLRMPRVTPRRPGLSCAVRLQTPRRLHRKRCAACVTGVSPAACAPRRTGQATRTFLPLLCHAALQRSRRTATGKVLSGLAQTLRCRGLRQCSVSRHSSSWEICILFIFHYSVICPLVGIYLMMIELMLTCADNN